MATPAYAIDVLSILFDSMRLEGWLYSTRPVASLELRGPGLNEGRHVVASYGTMPSEDVAVHHGPDAARVRFVETIPVDGGGLDLNALHLAVLYADGGIEGIGNLSSPAEQAAELMSAEFSRLLAALPAGAMLEVGSRLRSRVVRRGLVPPNWSYTGLDETPGPNVDAVGDPHDLSSLFPANSFDAVLARSVVQHLLMPWKFVIELNHVLKAGAIGLFTTHQCWPVHEAPLDFWRFSDRAWTALFNKSTGFRIIEASMGEPAFVVAQRAHAITNFGRSQSAYLVSNVLFQKTGPTKLKWPVRVEDTKAAPKLRTIVERPG